MTRVTGTDQLLMLLRERLTRTARGAAGARSTAVVGALPPIDRLRLSGAIAAVDDRQRRRAVVHALLLDELGDPVANDADFHRVLDRVMGMIDAMPGGTDLIDRATVRLRGG